MDIIGLFSPFGARHANGGPRNLLTLLITQLLYPATSTELAAKVHSLNLQLVTVGSQWKSMLIFPLPGQHMIDTLISV